MNFNCFRISSQKDVTMKCLSPPKSIFQEGTKLRKMIVYSGLGIRPERRDALVK